VSAQYAAAAELLASLDVDDLSDVERRPTAYMFDLHRAQTFAVLALAEELEALVELLRERLPVSEPATSRGMLDPRPCGRCSTPLGLHDERIRGHEWIAPSLQPHGDDPCGYVTDGVPCRIPLSQHRPIAGVTVGHEWIPA